MFFKHIEAAPADPILGLGEAFKAETRPEKVNLGIGVYKDASGATPIVKAVKEAEKRLLESETTKNYLTIDGVADYNEQTQILLFGADHEIVASRRAKTAQSLGGTGALRIAAEFAKRQLNAQTVWISNPTWPNHNAIFKAVGIKDKTYRYYDAAKHGLDWDGMIEDLNHLLSAHILLNMGVDSGDIPLLSSIVPARLAGQLSGHKEHQGDHRQGNQSQRDREDNHGNQRRHNRNRRADHLGNGLGDHLPKGIYIIGVNRHNIPVAMGVKVADRQVFHMGKEHAADLIHHSLRHSGHHQTLDQNRDYPDPVEACHPCHGS